MNPSTMGRAAVVGLVLLALAGCTGAGPSEVPSPSPAPPASATPDASPPAASPSPPPSDAPDPTPPPPARIAGRDGTPVSGLLGTIVWDGAADDAPWLAGSPLAVDLGATLTVDLAGLPAVDTWILRLAPAGAEGIGPVATAEGSASDPVAIVLPTSGGPWELSAQVRFAGGNEANWYWAVAPD